MCFVLDYTFVSSHSSCLKLLFHKMFSCREDMRKGKPNQSRSKTAIKTNFLLAGSLFFFLTLLTLTRSVTLSQAILKLHIWMISLWNRECRVARQGFIFFFFSFWLHIHTLWQIETAKLCLCWLDERTLLPRGFIRERKYWPPTVALWWCYCFSHLCDTDSSRQAQQL